MMIISRDTSAIFVVICLTIIQLLNKLPPAHYKLVFYNLAEKTESLQSQSSQQVIIYNKTEENQNDVTNTTTTSKLTSAATASNNTTMTMTTTTMTTTTNSSSTTTTTFSNNVSSIDDHSFLLEDDIDFNIRGDCGMHKCFFRSKNKLDHGYLIAREDATPSKKHTTSYKSLLTSYEDVQRLEIKLNNTTKFRHFLATDKPPIEIENPPFSLINKLNSISYFRSYKSKSKNKHYYGKEGTKRIMVQEVILAPDPALKLFCSMAQQHKTNIQLSNFINHINNKTLFLKTFNKEWEWTINKLLKKEPRLWYDFQILVDIKGQIYHIDLDRYYGIKKSRNKKYQQKNKYNCLPFIEWIKKSIISSHHIRKK